MILRHWQSEWNARNLFTGWVNAALTADGEQEAIRAGRLLAEDGLFPGVVHTSVQRRAIRTADLALTQCDRDWVPVRRSWRLNSNHYGALQGSNKAEVLKDCGEQQFMAWRRAYDATRRRRRWPPARPTRSSSGAPRRPGRARAAAVPD